MAWHSSWRTRWIVLPAWGPRWSWQFDSSHFSCTNWSFQGKFFAGRGGNKCIPRVLQLCVVQQWFAGTKGLERGRKFISGPVVSDKRVEQWTYGSINFMPNHPLSIWRVVSPHGGASQGQLGGGAFVKLLNNCHVKSCSHDTILTNSNLLS